MKLSRLLFHVYVNCWYIPLFVVLTCLKICLLSFLLTTEDMKKEVQGRSFHPNIMQMKKVRHKMTSTFSPETVEEWETLGNLETANLQPSYTNRTDPESIWLVFNHVPRCGGSVIVNILEELGSRNGFTHQSHEYRTPWPRFLLDQEQENLVSWFEYQHLPKSYNRHFFFVNFTKYQKFTKERPIYINILRDPVTRIRSEFIARRANKELAELEMERRNREIPGSGQTWYKLTFEECVLNNEEECKFEKGTRDFTLSVPFFCGQHNSCVTINDRWAKQMAKFTLEKYYSVVGVMERMDQTLTVLENYLPKFFSGADKIYRQLDEGERKKGPRVSDRIRKILEEKLHGEMELYRFAMQRLDMQHASIQ